MDSTADPRRMDDSVHSLALDLGGDEDKIANVIFDNIECLNRPCKRRFDCLLGALVGDAASVGSYWNYDPTKITQNLKQKGIEYPEFCSPPINTFFSIPEGSFSCHGDQIFAIMESVVESGGVSADSMAKSFEKAFGESSSYGDMENTQGQKRGWRNANVKAFVEAAAAGKLPSERGHPTDAQSDAYVKIIPIVAMYAGRPELMDLCEKAIRLTQDNDKAVVMGLMAARVLEGCILGKPMDVAVFECAATVPATFSGEIRDEFSSVVMDMYNMRKEKDTEVVVRDIGVGLEEGKKAMARSCMPPYCLQLPLQIIASCPESYSCAIRTSIMAGGDSCPRSAFVGACMGASMLGGGIGGDEGIPISWIGKIARGKEALALANKICGLASHLPPASA